MILEKGKLLSTVAAGLLLVLLSPVPIFAQSASESLSFNAIVGYYVPNHDGYGSSGFSPMDWSVLSGGTDERDLGGWGGAALLASLTYSRKFPVFVGDGPFFSGNNLEVTGKCEMTPLSIEGSAFTTLTPVAFLNFQAGGSVGTGWSLLGMTGLGINPNSNTLLIDDTPFGGALLRGWLAGTFQFDLAAVLPGDWNHVVVVATAKFEYRDNTAADKSDAWVWQADSGMNYDGWRYLGTYVLGYQMPKKVDFIGIMVDTEQYLGDVRDYGTMATGWGSDFVTLIISPIVNISFDERNSLSIIAQIKSTQDWSDLTTLNRFFGTRRYDGRQFYLYRIAFSYNLSLK